MRVRAMYPILVLAILSNHSDSHRSTPDAERETENRAEAEAGERGVESAQSGIATGNEETRMRKRIKGVVSCVQRPKAKCRRGGCG